MNLLLMLSFSRHQAHGVGNTLVFILQTGELSRGKGVIVSRSGS